MPSLGENLYSCRMQNSLDFDKKMDCDLDGCRLEYGMFFGDADKGLLLVKAGQDGSARGYCDKYLKLAYKIREKYGMSVVCCSNPGQVKVQMPHAMQVLQEEGLLNASTRVYFAGFSKGASIGCIQGAAYPQIVRYLLVNPPMMINTAKICLAAKSFTGEKMSFVFGSEDPSVGFVDLLRIHEHENMSVRVILGQDHNLSRDNFDLTELVGSELLF